MAPAHPPPPPGTCAGFGPRQTLPARWETGAKAHQPAPTQQVPRRKERPALLDERDWCRAARGPRGSRRPRPALSACADWPGLRQLGGGAGGSKDARGGPGKGQWTLDGQRQQAPGSSLLASWRSPTFPSPA